MNSTDESGEERLSDIEERVLNTLESTFHGRSAYVEEVAEATGMGLVKTMTAVQWLASKGRIKTETAGDKVKTVKAIKSLVFVEHIQEHLNDGEEVVCKICDKTLEEIWEEKEREE